MPNDDEDDPCRQGVAVQLLLPGSADSLRPVEKAATSELFSGEGGEKERTGQGDEDGEKRRFWLFARFPVDFGRKISGKN